MRNSLKESYSYDMAELNPIGAENPDRKRRRCRKKGMSLGMMLLQKGLGELLTVVLVSLAVYSATIADGVGSPINLSEYGLRFSGIVFAVGVVFAQYGTGFGAAHLLIASFLNDEKRERGFSKEVVWSHVVILVVQAGAWFLAAYIMSLLLPDPAFDRTLALTPSLAGYSLFGVFVFELLGKMLLDHVFVFSAEAYNGVWGVFANSLALGVLIAILGGLTGGSLNFFRSLGPHVVEGSLSTLDIVPHLASEIVAPVLTVIIKALVYPHQEKNKQN